MWKLANIFPSQTFPCVQNHLGRYIYKYMKFWYQNFFRLKNECTENIWQSFPHRVWISLTSLITVLLSSFGAMCQRQLSLNQIGMIYYWYKILNQAGFPFRVIYEFRELKQVTRRRCVRCNFSQIQKYIERCSVYNFAHRLVHVHCTPGHTACWTTLIHLYVLFSAFFLFYRSSTWVNRT